MADSSPAIQRHSAEVESFDVGDTKVQHFGLLMKKPFGHKSGRWQKRFFAVKDGFLLYYNDSEAKAFERSHHFNIHPKGVIPLSGCIVEETVNGPQKFALKITNQHFRGEIWVGADNEKDCKKWKKAIGEAGTVTWKNSQLGEKIILKMETKSKEMAEEMDLTIKKLNEEASALEEEKGKKSELEALSAKLEGEKKAIEEAAKNLREEKDTADQELQEILLSMKNIEEEKENLSKKTTNLEATLQTVSEEKQKTDVELEERARLALQLEEEKKKLEEKTTNLEGNLLTLGEQQRLTEEEKKTTIDRLHSQQLTAKKLEEENKQISNTALNLKANLEQVSQEKAITETKWREEKKKRIKTEKRLRLAEDSLKRLDKALRDSGVSIDLQIETDVRNLKDFFEDCIKEEQYEATKLEIMREAVTAKANYNIQKIKDVGKNDSVVLAEEEEEEEIESSMSSPRALSPSCEEVPANGVENGVQNGGVENGNVKNGEDVENGAVESHAENGIEANVDNSIGENGTENGVDKDVCAEENRTGPDVSGNGTDLPSNGDALSGNGEAPSGNGDALECSVSTEEKHSKDKAILGPDGSGADIPTTTTTTTTNGETITGVECSGSKEEEATPAPSGVDGAEVATIKGETA